MIIRLSRSIRCRLSAVVLAPWWASPTIQAQITYIDAREGPGGNTFATGSPPADTTWLNPDAGASADEDQWGKRTLGNNGTILQAFHNGTTMPELTTQIPGLPDDTYDIWVFFWDGPNTNQWTISAGLEAGATTTYSFDGPGNTTAPVAASTLAFTAPSQPITTEDPRVMYGVLLGQRTVTAGATISLYINNTAGGGSSTRTWYDGVGYAPSDPPEPEVNPDALLLAVDFNRTDHPGSPSQSLCRIIGGSATQSENQTSYSKTVGPMTVTVSRPDQAPFEFRGANGDSTRAIPGGDTSLSFLISDFIATRGGDIDLVIDQLPAGNYLFRSYHLESFTSTAHGFAQGSSTTTRNSIEAVFEGVVRGTVQPNSLGSAGLNTTAIANNQVPTLGFAFSHDGSTPATIRLRSTISNGPDRFLLLNGFQIFQVTP